MSKKTKLTIATRESPLALWQANWVKNELLKHFPQLTIELLGITTEADKLLTMPLYKVGGKGLFVKELEQALLTGQADIAVHSMKDVPMELPPGLYIPVVCSREDPLDVFVSNQFPSLSALPQSAVVGTSSLRRQSQLLMLRPDLQIVPLRGNISTRLAKLDKGDYDAIILAAAGLKRLDLGQRIRQYFTTAELLPAAGQGILGIECRSDDHEVKAIIQTLNDATSFSCIAAERSMCRYLGGGCHAPIAAFAEIKGHELTLRGFVATPDGKKTLHVQHSMPVDSAKELGELVAKELVAKGAKEILMA